MPNMQQRPMLRGQKAGNTGEVLLTTDLIMLIITQVKSLSRAFLCLRSILKVYLKLHLIDALNAIFLLLIDVNPEDEYSSTTTSIFPLNPSGFSRQNSIHHSLFNSGGMETVPEWLQKNNFNGSQNSKRNSNTNNDDDDIFSEKNNNNNNNGDVDIIDLKLKESMRKTPSRLISTDIANLNKEDKPVHGSMKVSPPRKRNARRLHSRSLASSMSANDINNDNNNNNDDDIFNRNNAALASRASEQLAAILSSSNNRSTT